eukprot:7388920-Prymnesium_polylepis.3
MKSIDRLLSTVSARVAQSSAAAPDAYAGTARELHESSTSPLCSCACLYGRPAVPIGALPTQCSYSTALQPTPPVAACTIAALPTRHCARSKAICTVLHVTGNVHACSNDSTKGLHASKGDDARASDASGAWARPKAAVPRA